MRDEAGVGSGHPERFPGEQAYPKRPYDGLRFDAVEKTICSHADRPILWHPS